MPRIRGQSGLLFMIALPAELTYRQARETVLALQKSMATHGGAAAKSTTESATIVVDAQALAVFDSSALAVLLECRRFALAQQSTLQVQALPPALRGLAVLYGVSDLLPAPVGEVV
jgi:phospholipid transport system transporter-binding protein